MVVPILLRIPVPYTRSTTERLLAPTPHFYRQGPAPNPSLLLARPLSSVQPLDMAQVPLIAVLETVRQGPLTTPMEMACDVCRIRGVDR